MSARDLLMYVLADHATRKSRPSARDERSYTNALSTLRSLLAEDRYARFALAVVDYADRTRLSALETAVQDAEDRLSKRPRR